MACFRGHRRRGEFPSCDGKPLRGVLRRKLKQPRKGCFGLAGFLLWSLLECSTLVSAVEVGRNEAYVITRWTVNDGLPQIGVRALAQTPDGYLWAGTFRGLARFDGVRFTRFGVGNTPAMISDFIQSLHVDAAGTLWVGVFRSQPLFLRSGIFREARLASGAPASEVSQFVNDGSGQLFGISNERLVLLEDGRVLSQSERAWLPAGRAWSTAVDAQGTLWVSAEEGLLRCAGKKIESVPVGGEVRNFGSLRFDQKGRLWGCAPEGLFFLRDGVFVRQPGFPLLSARGLTVARNNDVWVATADGLYRVRDGVLRRFGKEDGLAHDGSICVMEDRQGNIWFGSEEVGLHRLSERRVDSFPLGARGLPITSLNHFSEDEDGRPVLATARGLFVLKEGRFEAFGPVAEPGQRFEPSSMVRHRDGSWWVGTYGQGLFVGRNGQWTRVGGKALGSNGWVNTVYADVDGSVLVAGETNILRFRNDRWEPYPLGATVSQADVLAIRRDRRGTLWMGSQRNGLIQQEGEHVRVWRRADGLGSDTIHDVLEDREGRIWVAGNGGGLALWSDRRWHRWTMAEGLAGDVILQLLEDAEGFLWLGTEHGISRINPKELWDQASGRVQRVHPLRLGQADGAPSDQCEITSSPTGLRQRSGVLWFSTPNGPARVDPARIKPEAVRPQVVVEQVKVNETEVARTNVGTRVELPPGARRVEFHYSGLEFNAPEQIRFRHRLEGFDEDWVEAGTRRTAFYTRIPPGEYRFRVIAANRDNFWSETGADLAVVVRPFFYETLTFRISVGVMLLAVAAQGIRYGAQRRLRRLLQQAERQRALERERTRIARDMHDDIGARLTELSLLSDLAQRDTPPEAAASANVTRLARLTREVSKSMREVVWAIDSQNDQLDQLVEHLCQHAGQFVQPTGMRLRLEAPTALPAIAIGTDRRHNLFLAFKEALNNAVKHSGASEIRIRLQVDSGVLSVELTDNGRGFSPETRSGSGHGLGSMAHRLQELGGECEVSSRPGRGTSVHLRLPLPAKTK